MTKSDDKRVPALRFKGFTDEWEQRKLGEVSTFINGRAYKQSELLNSGKYKVLRVGNFYTNDSWYYSNLELADKYYIKKGDLVYTWSATFGPHIWDGEKVIYHYHIWKIKLSKYLDKNFTLQILEADKAKLLSNTNGSTMIHVTKNNMENKVISIPNIKEQKKIGECLMKFDSLIELQQRKATLLKQLKSTLLDRLISGKDTPLVRFKEFKSNWTVFKLKDIITKTIKGIAKAEMHGKESIYLDTHYLNGGNPTKVDSPTNVSSNDIIILWDGSQAGKVYYGFSGALGSTLKSFTPKYSSNYLFQYLKKYQNKIFVNYRTPNIPHVIKDFTTVFKVNLPSTKEQIIISNLLKTLDAQITVKSDSVNYLKNIKHFLLQNMFI
ncbi:restriction endonuclease subunit S [Lactobacillus paragasseri]|uniref:restriction endonuclease subunit S n=2 Tax=Lactobacillus paragasseri TaxID=2107999 RepID=UPI0028E6690C|nr:restriction endonuclease subunit S [Lactobacillus paragasseri]MDT9608273.1 restriction endonuclease subunit S [Lactobacillus paragasseri]